MNADRHTDDRLAEALAALPAHDVPADRAARIAERCRAELGHGVRRRADGAGARFGAHPVPWWQRVLEPALVAGISAAFLVEVIGRALALEGF